MADDSELCKIIEKDDGSRITAIKGLRLVPLPKLNFKKRYPDSRISDDLEDKLHNLFDLFSDTDSKVNPNEIKNALVSIGIYKYLTLDFHKDEPLLFKAIEELAFEYDNDQKLITFPKFMNHLNERFSNTNERESLNRIFNNMKNKKIVFKKINK